MSVKVIKDGVVIHDDKKPSVEELLQQQAMIIQDLQNQVKDLKKEKTKK